MHFNMCTFPRVYHQGRAHKRTSTALQDTPSSHPLIPGWQLPVIFLMFIYDFIKYFSFPLSGLVTVDSVGFTWEAVILGSPRPTGIFFRFSAFPRHTLTCSLKRSEHARLSWLSSQTGERGSTRQRLVPSDEAHGGRRYWKLQVWLADVNIKTKIIIVGKLIGSFFSRSEKW